VLQGERPMATDNKSLGKFILDGIPPSPRGIPQIEVTFDINANGILNVTAQDKATSRSQHITISASSGLNDSEVEKMRKEAELHAEEDRQRKDLVEARNNADNLIYQTEKTIRESGDKLDSALKSQAEEKVSALRQEMAGENVDKIRSSSQELEQIVQQLGASLYQQQQPPAGDAQPGETPPSSGSGGSDGEDVVEGEFKSV